MAAKNLYSVRQKEKELYGSSNTMNTRTQSTLQNSGWSAGQSTSQSNIWNAGQSATSVQSSTAQKPKREKTPSELGEEVIKTMLEDYAKEERQKQAAADRMAQYGGSTARTKATRNREPAQYGGAAGRFGESTSYGSQTTAKPAVWNKETAPYSGAAAAQYNSPAAAKPIVPKREKTSSELGDEVVARVLVEEGIMDPKDLEEYLASFEEPSTRTFTTGVGRSDVLAMGNDGFRATPEEVMLSAAPDFAAAGIDPSVLQAGLRLGNTAKQLADDTHIAEGMSVPLYLTEKVLSGAATGLEGVYNNVIDWARAGVNADLMQQAQQAQQFAWLGEPYQRNADLIASSVQSVQEALPEAAENLRSHRAAEYGQQIDERYDAGGYIKLLGDLASAGGQTLPTVGINLATGGTMGLPYIFSSAAGNAAAEARAGGASEDMAFAYGLASGGLEAVTEKISDGLPGMKGGWIDNWLADYAETNMGRAALKATKDAVGEGFEEFASGMVQPFLAKMWNGDERDFWQTLGESAPDALYDGFLGMANGFGLSLPGNISNIRNAHIVDAALDILDNGGMLSDTQLAMASAAAQELTKSWGDTDQSKWSRNMMEQWENARNGDSGGAVDSSQGVPPNFIPLPMFNNTKQNGPANASEVSAQAQGGQPAATDFGFASSQKANNTATTENGQTMQEKLSQAVDNENEPHQLSNQTHLEEQQGKTSLDETQKESDETDTPKLSWKERMSVTDGKTMLQSNDGERVYEIPSLKEIPFLKNRNGMVTLLRNIAHTINGKDYRDYVKAFADKNLITKFNSKGDVIQANPIQVKSDGTIVLISQKGINDFSKKIRGQGWKASDNVNSIMVLDKLIEEGIEVDRSENKKGRANPYTYYQSKLNIEGREYNVTIHIKNTPINNLYYYHSLEKIEITPPNGTSYHETRRPGPNK